MIQEIFCPKQWNDRSHESVTSFRNVDQGQLPIDYVQRGGSYVGRIVPANPKDSWRCSFDLPGVDIRESPHLNQIEMDLCSEGDNPSIAVALVCEKDGKTTPSGTINLARYADVTPEWSYVRIPLYCFLCPSPLSTFDLSNVVRLDLIGHTAGAVRIAGIRITPR